MAKKQPEKAKTTPAASSKKPAAAQQVKSSKPGKPSAPAGAPMIDTDFAAQAAARMLAAGLSRREQPRDDDDKGEGSLIKQLKADLNKPAATAVSNVLNKSAPEGAKKPSPLPFGRKQVGHNQTFGGDLTRSGVPRRTSG